MVYTYYSNIYIYIFVPGTPLVRDGAVRTSRGQTRINSDLQPGQTQPHSTTTSQTTLGSLRVGCGVYEVRICDRVRGCLWPRLANVGDGGRARTISLRPSSHVLRHHLLLPRSITFKNKNICVAFLLFARAKEVPPPRISYL